MVKVNYSTRLVVDASFVKWLIKRDRLSFFHLTHIKTSSQYYKKHHNLILESDVNEVLENSSEIQESTIRRAFKGFEMPIEITSNKDLKTREDQLVVYAINIASERPWSTHILTTKDNIGKYTSSSHYKDVKSIKVKAEEDAYWTIKLLHRQFITERESSR